MKFDEKIRGSQLLREDDKIPETFDEILAEMNRQMVLKERYKKEQRPRGREAMKHLKRGRPYNKRNDQTKGNGR